MQRTLTFLAAMAVAGLLASMAAAAPATYQQCHKYDMHENDPCDTTEHISLPVAVPAGSFFTTYGNIDVEEWFDSWEICGYSMYATYDDRHFRFIEGEKSLAQHESPMACRTQYDPPTPWCPNCNTLLECEVWDHWADDEPPYISEVSELKFTWQVVFGGNLGGYDRIWADVWTVYNWGADNRCVDIDATGVSYPDIGVTMVPEPGELLMLGAGLPFLALLRRRRERHTGRG